MLHLTKDDPALHLCLPLSEHMSDPGCVSSVLTCGEPVPLPIPGVAVSFYLSQASSKHFFCTATALTNVGLAA